MSERKLIYVFAGYGVHSASLLGALERAKREDPSIDVQEVRNEDLQKMGRIDPDIVHAFILPGGARPQYDVQIGAHGFGLLRDYVEKGGAFYGICAGAYYASEEFHWRPHTHEYKNKKPGLSFFNGISIGPEPLLLKHNKTFGEWYDAAIVNVDYSDDTCDRHARSLYWNGPILHSHDNFEGIDILAHINVQGDDCPAIIKIPVGKGFAILSSIHPEVSLEQLEAHINAHLSSSDYVAVLCDELRPYEPAREDLWRSMLSHALDRKNMPNPQAGFWSRASAFLKSLNQ